MSTYTDTYLSVKVTATGNTARTMRSWTPAARQEYLRDQIVMFLNGRRPDFCVECVDLEAVELQRCVTHADKVCLVGRGETAPVPEAAGATADKAEEQPPPSPPQPPCRRRASGRSGAVAAARSTALSRKIAAPTTEGGNKGRCEFQRTWTARVVEHGQGEITPTEAARWLRENGHATVADEIDGEGRFEPVGTVPVVGDVLECVHLAEGFPSLRYRVGDKFHIGVVEDGSAYPTEGPINSIGFSNAFVGNAKLGPRSSHFRILKRAKP